MNTAEALAEETTEQGEIAQPQDEGEQDEVQLGTLKEVEERATKSDYQDGVMLPAFRDIAIVLLQALHEARDALGPAREHLERLDWDDTAPDAILWQAERLAGLAGIERCGDVLEAVGDDLAALAALVGRSNLIELDEPPFEQARDLAVRLIWLSRRHPGYVSDVISGGLRLLAVTPTDMAIEAVAAAKREEIEREEIAKRAAGEIVLRRDTRDWPWTAKAPPITRRTAKPEQPAEAGPAAGTSTAAVAATDSEPTALAPAPGEGQKA
jgi:hypothetical protein